MHLHEKDSESNLSALLKLLKPRKAGSFWLWMEVSCSRGLRNIHVKD